MAKTTLGRGGRTMAGPGSQELIRMLAGNGADPALIAKLHMNRPGVVNTFDPAVFQEAARIGAANLDREAAERQAMIEAQLQRDQLAQQAAMQAARLNLDRQRARADYTLQNRAQGFREQQSQIDNRYRDRAFDTTDARQREELDLRRQNQQFQQGMSQEELALRRRAAGQSEQQFREEMGFRREGQQFQQGLSLAELEMRGRAAGQSERQFREEMDLRRQNQQFQQGLSKDELGLRRRAADLNELTSREELRLRQQAFGLDQRRMDLAETQAGKQFSDAQRTDTQWRMLAASEIERDSSDMLKAARQMSLTPEGRRLFAKLSDERRAIASAKGDMTPDQYADMMGQWMNRFQAADLAGYEQQLPEINEQIAQRFRVMPNGMSVWMQPGKDGNWDLKLLDGYSKGQAAIDAAAIKAGNPNGAAADVTTRWVELYGGTKNAQKFAKDYADAEKRLIERWQNSEESLDAVTMPEIKQHDVLKEMRRMVEIQVMSESGQADQPQPPATAISPAGAIPNTADALQSLQGSAEQTPAAPQAGVAPEVGTENDDEAYFSSNPVAGQLRGMFDQAMANGEKAPQVFRELAAAVQANKLPSHPAKYLAPAAISTLEAMGSTDPVGDATRSVVEALRTGEMHYALLQPHEQRAFKTLPVLNPKTDEEEIKKLPPGAFYLDPGLKLHSVPAEDEPLYNKAMKAMVGDKPTPEQIKEISRREIESISNPGGTRRPSPPPTFPY